jgi:hypothetical protein
MGIAVIAVPYAGLIGAIAALFIAGGTSTVTKRSRVHPGAAQHAESPAGQGDGPLRRSVLSSEQAAG